jgi:hypothetical protein
MEKQIFLGIIILGVGAWILKGYNMNTENMTRKQFMQLPRKKWDEEIRCNTIVIIPYEINRLDVLKYMLRKRLNRYMPTLFKEPEIYEISGMHDSGYRLMSYALCHDNEPFCITDAGDVLHIDGIGGFGYKWFDNFGHVPANVPVAGWTMDCLPNSGLLRLWCSEDIMVGRSLSSQEVFRIKREK